MEYSFTTRLPMIVTAEDYHEFNLYKSMWNHFIPEIDFIELKDFNGRGAYGAVFFIPDCIHEAKKMVKELNLEIKKEL